GPGARWPRDRRWLERLLLRDLLHDHVTRWTRDRRCRLRRLLAHQRGADFGSHGLLLHFSLAVALLLLIAGRLMARRLTMFAHNCSPYWPHQGRARAYCLVTDAASLGETPAREPSD